jgi:hypothetical protein
MYEAFVLVNVVLAQLFLRQRGLAGPLNSLTAAMSGHFANMILLLSIGVGVRIVISAVAGRGRSYLRQIARWTWWVEAARLVVMGALAMYVYTSLKILLPLAGGENADEVLWAADYALLLGHSPTVLMLELFGHPRVLQSIDWSYEILFRSTMYTVIGAALSSPSQRLRVALVGAKSAMWITGAWLYYVFPSLGPAYRFPELWDPIAANLPRTHLLLKALFANFLVVTGEQTGSVNVMLGIAAFPSLHVALHTLVALWGRRFSPAIGIVGIAGAIVIFVGSVVTGWHYFIDSLAGLVIGAVFFAVFFSTYHLGRWLKLFRAVRRGRTQPRLRQPFKIIERAFGVH